MVKDLIPSGDPGKFNLQIDGNTDPQGANVGDGGTTGEETLNTGTHNVGETAGTGTTWPTTRSRSAAWTPPTATRPWSSTTGDSAGPLDVSVTYGSDIVCTITNTRETGKLEVVKDLIPSGDPGKFNLQIDGNTDPQRRERGRRRLDRRGDAQHRHPQRRRGRRHGTDLADYQKSISCVDTANGNAAVASTTGDSAGPLDVTVTTTPTSSARSPTHVRPASSRSSRTSTRPTTPASSTCRSTATRIRTARTWATAARRARRRSTPARHNVGEAAGTGTSLTDYQKSISCVDTANGNAAVGIHDRRQRRSARCAT